MPNNSATIIPSRFKIWVTIKTMDGVMILDQCPVAHATMNFALHGVGTATFILATGTHAETQKLAPIHTVADKIDSQVLVSCYMIVDGWYNENTPWPQNKAFRIWDGVSSGLNFTLNRQTLSLQLGSTHWLSRLDMASVAAGNILKGSCDSFTSTFGVEVLGAGNLMAAQSALTLMDGVDIPNSDFWENIVKTMLLGLADKSNGKIRAGAQNWVETFLRLNSGCANRSTTKKEPEIGNAEAAHIIKNRFNDTKHIVKGVLKGDFPNTFHAADIHRSYLDVVAQIIGGRFGSSTALEKIYGCAQTFMYNIIYNVESATNAPHVPVLTSSKLWRTLNANEYTTIRGSSFTPPEIAGVGIYGQEYTGLFDRSQDSGPIRPDEQFIIGAFKASDRGKILMLDAPPYLFPQIRQDWNQKTLRNAQSATGAPTSSKQPPGIDKDVNNAINKVGCMYARLRYFDAVFSMRTAMISGKLRFDIAPGSMIRLKNAHISLPQFNTTELFATVEAVTVVIDAQDGHAITNIALSHLRTKKEDDYAPDAHPFFQVKPWIGSPLVKIFDNDLKAELE
jgi:hypothetical protein